MGHDSPVVLIRRVVCHAAGVVAVGVPPSASGSTVMTVSPRLRLRSGWPSASSVSIQTRFWASKASACAWFSQTMIAVLVAFGASATSEKLTNPGAARSRGKNSLCPRWIVGGLDEQPRTLVLSIAATACGFILALVGVIGHAAQAATPVVEVAMVSGIVTVVAEAASRFDAVPYVVAPESAASHAQAR